MTARPGRMNRLITIMKPDPTAVQDSHGEKPLGWLPVFQVWAEIRGMPGSEGVTAGQLGGAVTRIIRIWWRDDIDCTMKAVLGSREFGFVSVIDPDERRRELLITAVELTG